MTVAIGPALEADQLQLLVDDCAARVGGRVAAQFEPEPDVLAHGAPGQQAELLEDHGDACRDAAGAASPQSQLATSTCRSPSCTSTRPRVTRLSPLAARSSVDLPEPDRPISTEIWPCWTVRLALADADDDAGGGLDRGAVLAGVERPQRRRRSAALAPRPARLANRMSTLSNSTRGAHSPPFDPAAG